MDVQNAVVQVGLENGGGGPAVAIAMPPCPADPEMKELQPLTWLRTGSCIAAMVAGIVLVIVGGALDTPVRIGMSLSGVALLFVATFAPVWLCPMDGCEPELLRFGPD